MNWYKNMPLFASCVQLIVHLAYDAFPVLHLMLKHHKTFQHEERQTTLVVMSSQAGWSRQSEDTELNQYEENNRLTTLKNLENTRFTMFSGGINQIGNSALKRTMDDDDRAMMKNLLEEDSRSHSSSSVNDSGARLSLHQLKEQPEYDGNSSTPNREVTITTASDDMHPSLRSRQNT